MADNVQLSTNVGAGATVRTLEDGSSIQWPVTIIAHATTVGTPDVLTIPTAAALADNTANPTTIIDASCLLCYDGATWDRVRGDSTDGLLVNLGGNNDVTLSTLPDTAAGDLAAMVVDLAAMEALLITIDADTGAIKTAVELLDNSVDGNYLNVNANIAGTDIVGGAGVVAAGVQRVTLASDDPGVTHLATISGDTTSLDTKVTACNTGAVVISSGTITTITNDVSIADGGNSITVDNGGTFAVQVDGAALTALQLIDDSIFADDAAFTLTSSKVTVSGAIRDDTLGALAAIEGDAVPLRVNSTGALHVTGGGGGTEYTEDAVAPGDPVGTATMIKRDDIIVSSPVTAEDDWMALLGTAEGALWVQDFNSDAILSDTTAIKAAVETIDNAIAGNEMQVDVLTVPTGQAASANSMPVVLCNNMLAGTYIGDVKLQANSGVDVGDVDVTSIAAGTNTIGGTISQQSSSVLYDGTTACTVKRKSGVAASGTTAIIAAVAAKKIRILALFLKATSATVTNVYLATTTDTDVLGNAANPIPLAVDADGDNDSGFVLPYNQGGWTETSTANEALNLILSAAQDVVYCITYIEVA